MVPFSPLRAYVMGVDEARERTSATPAEIEQMKALLRESMNRGAWGYSNHKNLEDRAEDGGLLPSHVSSEEESLALAQVVGEYRVGTVYWMEGAAEGDEEGLRKKEFIRELARACGHPMQWGVVVQLADAEKETGLQTGENEAADHNR